MYPSIKRNEKNEQKHKFIHLHHLPIHLTFSFSKYRLFAAKHTSILSTYFFNGGYRTSPLEFVQRSSGFLGSPGHLFRSSNHTVHVSTVETTWIWKASFNRVIVSTFDFLISHKILHRRIIWSKHQFSCLRGDTLSGHIISTCSIAVYYFFYCERSRHLLPYTSHASKCWMLLPLFLSSSSWTSHSLMW